MIYLAPSDAPSEVEAIVISSFSIYVSWNHIRYEDMNGELLGYRVMYWAQSDSNNIMNVSVTYPNASSLLTDLNDQETYTIHVSAFNSAGNGPSQKTEARTNPHIPGLENWVFISPYFSTKTIQSKYVSSMSTLKNEKLLHNINNIDNICCVIIHDNLVKKFPIMQIIIRLVKKN